MNNNSLTQIIKVDDTNMTISARDLHEALGIQKRFSAWFESNAKDFVDGEDYFGVYLKVQGNQYGGEQQLQDYQLTVDMAKHLCLMSHTEKGRECRQYLIDLEKAWNTPEQIMARALRMADKTIASLQDQVKQVSLQNSQLLVDKQIMQPKADYFDELVDRNLLTSFTDCSKELGIKRKTFIAFLLDHDYIYRDKKGNLVPKANSKADGLFEVKQCSNQKTKWAGCQTLITPKGVETFKLLCQGL